MRKLGWSVPCVFAALLAVTPAWAQDEKASAQEHFAKGQKAFGAGDYRAAALAFEEAYRLKPHHAPLWNAARSWQRAGENVRAANLYVRYLREAPTGTKDRDVATAALADLSTKLGRITVQTTGPTDLKVDDAPSDPDGVYVVPGEHVVSGVAGDAPVKKSVSVVAGQALSVTLDPPRKDEPPPRIVVVTPPPPKPAGFRMPWVVVAAGGVLALAGGGVTIWSGLDTNAKRQRFATRYDEGTANQDDLDEGKAAQLRTNVILGATIGVAVLTGVAALFVDWRGSRSTAVPAWQVAPAWGGASVVYRH